MKQPIVDEPDMDEYLTLTMFEGCNSEATDGCSIEPDGTCPHGHVSWELFWGII